MRKNFSIQKTETTNVLKLYTYVRKKYTYTALLESLGEYDPETARYCIIGVLADQILYEKDGEHYVKELPQNTCYKVEDWTKILDDWTCEERDDASPLQLGTIGYVGYENLIYFENMKIEYRKTSKCPQIFLVHYSLLYVYDRLGNQGYWVKANHISKDVVDELESAFVKEDTKQEDFYTIGDAEADFTYDDYIRSINQCVDYIKRGDIFQANITMRYHGRYQGDPFILYEELRKTTPNPYFAFFDFEFPFISTSPEGFLKVSDQTISSRPIKGTVRCVIDGKDQKDFLLGSTKNIAENVMITDLIRNDIGRISEIGTVDVPKLCALKTFNNLYHLETVVEGRLKKDVSMSKILKTNFPGGSITGAPKVRALEIINELEFADRGPYCGAIGFWGERGYLNTSIGIRVIYFDADHYYLHAGGGITAKSDAVDEYDELILKIERLLSALKQYNVLAECRQRLDQVDLEILKLFEKRFSIIQEVKEIKEQYQIPAMQESRVNDMLRRRFDMIETGELNLSKSFVQKLLEIVVEEAMNIENEK